MDERNAIANLIGSLAVYVDARRWEDILLLLAPEVRVDYTSLFGGEAEVLAQEKLVGRWSGFVPGFTRTCHVIGAPVIDIDGETAQAAASVVAWHFLKEPELKGNDCWFVGGCYEMSFRKLDGGWRMDGLTLARAWAEGNLDLPRIVSERMVAK
jgi:hypothetical protein